MSIKQYLPANGQHYHALNPETFWWAHATFQRMVDRIAAHWDRHRLTDREWEQLYTEGCEWYRRYGVTDSVLPPTRADFESEQQRYFHEVLQPNPASDYLIEFINRRAIPDMSASPDYPAHPRLRPLADKQHSYRAIRLSIRSSWGGVGCPGRSNGIPPHARGGCRSAEHYPAA